MSTIAVFGATGFAGGHITAEALERGHEVIAVSRRGPADARPGVTVRAGSVSDDALVEELAGRAAALVIAVPGAQDGAPLLAGLVPGLLSAAGRHGARLAVVGGAGSLLVAPGGPRLVDTVTGIPDWVVTEMNAQADALAALRAAKTPASWFYVSPAPMFGAHAPGTRTGTYRLGGDVIVADSEGQAAISGADFAIAFVDEIDKPAHHQERFTVGY